MSYAVRNDSVYGVRAVNSADDCLENEYFSETFVEAPTPDLIDTLPNLSQYQFRMCLINRNLFDQVIAAIDNIQDATQKLKVKTAFDYANFFNRKDELILYMSSVLNLSDDDVNVMWQEALAI